MEKIQWKDEYSVGVALLDEQHKRMIEIINTLIDAPTADVGSKTVAETLKKMAEYSQAHFQEEELLFEEFGYPDAAAHAETHKEYVQQTVVFCGAAMTHVDAVPERLLRFLKDWWVDHILGEDLKYKEFFKEAGVR